MASKIQKNKVIFSGSYKDLSICVRQATHGDYDDVMNIDKYLFKGADIIPSTYDAIMNDPTTHSFVVESDGKVVAFVCLSLDGLNNTTTATTAGRVKPEYRHKGLFGFLRKIAQAEMKKNFPTLLYDWSLSSLNEKVIKFNEEANGRLVEKRHMLFGYINVKDIPTKKCKEWINTKIVKLNEWQLIEQICKPDVLQYLFPNGICLHTKAYIPFPATQHCMTKLTEKDYIGLSGSLESDDLGFSSAFVEKSLAGLDLVFCYDGSPVGNVIKGHILEALINLEQSPLVRLARDNQSTDSSMFVLAVMLPSTADFDDIYEFVKSSISSGFRQIVPPGMGVFQRIYD